MYRLLLAVGRRRTDEEAFDDLIDDIMSWSAFSTESDHGRCMEPCRDASSIHE